MFFMLVFFSSLLVACTALASPWSPSEAPLGRRLSERVNLVERHDSNVLYNDSWSGAALLQGGNGTYTTVSGTFKLPRLYGPDGVVAAWVGIDGWTFNQIILQTGVAMNITNGVVCYFPFYAWFYPGFAYSDFPVKADDEIRATITAYSTTTAVTILENLTTGQSAKHEFASPGDSLPVAEANAEWIVEDYVLEFTTTPLTYAHYTPVTFMDATASGPSGKIYTPADATIFKTKHGSNVLTSVSLHEDGFTVTRLH